MVNAEYRDGRIVVNDLFDRWKEKFYKILSKRESWYSGPRITKGDYCLLIIFRVNKGYRGYDFIKALVNERIGEII